MIRIRENTMNNNTFVHKYSKSLIDKNDVVVDMTLGNGNDALFFSDLAKKVYGFDIAKQAINNSKEKLKDKDNVQIILDSHLNFDKYVKEKVRLFVFNLGYLPHADKVVMTDADVTLKTFIKAYEYLNKNDYIIITFYLGHIGGKDEFYLLDEYIKKNSIPVLEIYKQDRINSPVTYIIRKD